MKIEVRLSVRGGLYPSSGTVYIRQNTMCGFRQNNMLLWYHKVINRYTLINLLFLPNNPALLFQKNVLHYFQDERMN